MPHGTEPQGRLRQARWLHRAGLLELEALHAALGQGQEPMTRALGNTPGRTTRWGAALRDESRPCPYCLAPWKSVEPGGPVCASCGLAAYQPDGELARRLAAVGPEPPPAMSAQIGLGDLGPYDLISEIARGGMGIVYLARDRRMGREIALKLLLAGESASPEQLARFQREAQAAGRLQHPHIVGVYDVGESPRGPYFTMEYVHGLTLDRYLKEGRRARVDVLELMIKVLRAVHHAHEHGIVHRDLKPGNILVTSEGEPKITDFGLAKQMHQDTLLTQSGMAMGTPFYMPPEQVRGETQLIDARSDVYAMGVMLYEALAGALPFQGETAVALYQRILQDDPPSLQGRDHRIPADLDTIVLKALQKEPHRRYDSAAAMADDLARHLRGDSIQARPESMLGKLQRRLRRHPRLTALSLSFALLAPLCAFGAVRWAEERQRRTQEALAAADAAARLERARALKLRGLQAPAAYEAQELVARHPGRPEAVFAQGLLAQCLLAEDRGRAGEALRAQAAGYLLAPGTEEGRARLLDAIELSLSLKTHGPAGAALDRLLPRLSGGLRQRALLLRAQLLAETYRWSEAAQLLAQLPPAELPAGLRPGREALCGILGALGGERIVALNGAQRWVPLRTGASFQLVLLHPQGELETVALDGTVPQRRRYVVQFNGAVAWTGAVEVARVGDIDHDGRLDLALAYRRESDSLVLFLRVAPGGADWEVFHRLRLGTSAIQDLAIGDYDGDGLAEVAVGTGHPWGPSWVLHYDADPQRGRAEKLCKDLPGASTGLVALATGDVDGDGVDDLVGGTAEWQKYDLRVIKPIAAENEYREVWTRALGRMRSVAVHDLDGDGFPEIIAAKSTAWNSGVFGQDTPFGPPEGLYAFDHREGQYRQVWHEPFGDRGVDGDIMVHGLSASGDTLVALAHIDKAQSPRSGAWLIWRRWRAGGFERLDVRVAAQAAALVDLAGRGRPSLLIQVGDELHIHGEDQP